MGNKFRLFTLYYEKENRERQNKILLSLIFKAYLLSLHTPATGLFVLDKRIW
ncbi:conserved domain protein [Paraprevotella xylaniphila YIT 11841]|uniref:Conserved domain protein n=1 Tax=Paraprevotella xylaniphila YIT 11841 TaxID=762982 RepID=F3QXD5_9BACT|nr:conserved domain protein [Paraprevotella xylaniphila YIT 11841]